MSDAPNLSPIRHALLVGLGLFVLFFMPYATLVLQAMRHGMDILGLRLSTVMTLITIGWKELIVGLIGLCVLVYVARNRRLPFRLHAMDWLMLLFIAYGVVVGGMIIHHSKAIVFGFRYDFFVFVVYFIARCFSSSRETLLRLGKALNLAAVPMLLFGLAQVTVLSKNFLTHLGYSDIVQVSGNPLPPYHLIGSNLIRAMSTFPGPNSLAMYAVLLLLLTLCFGRTWWPRRWWLADIALITVVLLTTYSRGHFLALGAAAIIYCITRMRQLRGSVRRLQVAIIAVFLGIISAGLVLSLVQVPDQGNPGTIQALVFHNSSSILHRQARLDAWDHIRKHPWGSGLGTSGLATTNTGGAVRNPESWYVQVTQEFGWLGLAIALVVVCGVFAWLARAFVSQTDPAQKRVTLFFILSFTALAVSAQFLPDWFEVGSLTWWTLFGLFVSDADRLSVTRVPSQPSAERKARS